MDSHPIFRAQTFIWIGCLVNKQGIDPAHIFVHTPDRSGDFLAWMDNIGINIVHSEPFDSRNPYCNKILQLRTFSNGIFEQVMLMDCDTAWVGDSQLPVASSVAAKIVDFSNPSESVTEAIFAAAGHGQPIWHPVSFPATEGRIRADWNNCNGGIYIINGSLVTDLENRWKHWARWSLDNEEAYKEYKQHVDQVSFALAMRDLGLYVTHLDIIWNYPTHIATKEHCPDVMPEILHYHREVTPHMCLTPAGVPQVDKSINQLNELIADWTKERLHNSMFWDFRYSYSPELGSGIGSRGANLEYKRSFLADQLRKFKTSSVLDVGCGDLEVTRSLEIENYIGVDVSDEALRIAREKRPDWSFQQIHKNRRLPSADIVICLDVLIHQSDKIAFHELIGQLTDSTRTFLLVSGYEEKPEFSSQLTRFYEPLSAALCRTNKFSNVMAVGKYRDTVIFRAQKLYCS